MWLKKLAMVYETIYSLISSSNIVQDRSLLPLKDHYGGHPVSSVEIHLYLGALILTVSVEQQGAKWSQIFFFVLQKEKRFCLQRCQSGTFHYYPVT